MKHRLLLALILVLGGGFSAFAEAKSNEAFAHVEAFAFGGIGAAGTISEGELAFRKVLASHEAARDFHQLLEVGNRPAKCYALVALRRLDPKQFPALADQFKNDRAQVKTIGGCIITELPMNSVVTGIVKGNYDRYLDPKPRSR